MIDDDPLWIHLILTAPMSQRDRMGLARSFDRRLADLVRTTAEPTLGQMRFAWWEEALTGDGPQRLGEPLVEQMRTAWSDEIDRTAMTRIIDGWETLLLAQAFDADMLNAYASGRGTLFALIGGRNTSAWLKQAGEAWALWDLSGHLSNAAAAHWAIGMAKDRIGKVPQRGWAKSLVPLRLLSGLVRQDAMAGSPAPAGMTPRQYRRLIWLSLTGGG